MSLLEHHGQQQQQQQQQPEGLGAAWELGLGRRVAEDEEAPGVVLVRARIPNPATEVVLPAEVAAAAAGVGAGSSHQLRGQWYTTGLGSACEQHGSDADGAAGSGGARKTAAEREEEELQRAIQLSMAEEQQRLAAAGAAGSNGLAAAGGDGAAGTAAAAVEDPEDGTVTPVLSCIPALGAAAGEVAAAEDTDLQRALQLSLLDQGGASSAPAALPLAAGPAEAVAGWQGEQQQQQGQEQGRPDPVVSIFGELLPAPTGAAGVGGAPAAAAAPSMQQQQLAAGAREVDAGGGDWSAVDVQVPAEAVAEPPAYRHAEIVEDDALLQDGPEAAEGAADAAAEADGACGGAGTKTPPALYRLHAVVNHEGPAASCGHFTSDICDPATRAWHRLNDSLTSRISATEARSSTRQRQCYLLFYVASPGTSGAPS